MLSSSTDKCNHSTMEPIRRCHDWQWRHVSQRQIELDKNNFVEWKTYDIYVNNIRRIWKTYASRNEANGNKQHALLWRHRSRCTFYFIFRILFDFTDASVYVNFRLNFCPWDLLYVQNIFLTHFFKLNLTILDCSGVNWINFLVFFNSIL